MIVYDPFMGIGTTALACIRLGIDYLGTEIDPTIHQGSKREYRERKRKGYSSGTR